jgi:hypothetical protein
VIGFGAVSSAELPGVLDLVGEALAEGVAQAGRCG